MSEFWFAAAVFVSLASASLVTMYVSPVLPARHRDDDTNAVIRLMANIFVVMTSLVFGLMINSSKNTFETVNASAHSYATSLILLDHSLRTYGIAGRDARALLGSYAQESVRHPARANDVMEGAPDTAGRALDSLGDALMAISPQDAYHEGLIAGIRSQYQDIVRQRWAIIEQSEGVIPFPLVLLLLAWLILIFGSFGYRAPQNAVIIASMVISSGLVAAAFYLVLDMDLPFSGFIQVSDEPLRERSRKSNPERSGRNVVLECSRPSVVRALVGRFLERPIAASKLRKWNGFAFKNYTKRLNIRLAKTDLPRIIAAKTAVKFVIVDG